MKAFFLTLISLICFSVCAQVDSFQKDIITYLELNGTPKQYSAAYDEMFDVLKRNFEREMVPESVWTSLQKDKSKSVSDAISFLSFAYRNHFTQEEIGEMTRFYKTPAAQKMVSGEPLTGADNDKIKSYYESDVAKKMNEKRDVLSADISEISSQWSRELFNSKIEALQTGGHIKGK